MLKQLTDKKARLIAEMQARTEEYNAEAGKDLKEGEELRAWTQEQLDNMERMAGEVEKMDGQIATAKRVEELLTSNTQSRGISLAGGAEGSGVETEGDEVSEFANWIKTGNLSDGRYSEKYILFMPKITRDEKQRAVSMRALTRTTGASAVPGAIVDEVVKAMYDGDTLRAAGARVRTTPHGNDIKVNRVGLRTSGTGEAVPVVDENAASAAYDPSITHVPLRAHTYRGFTDVTDEMLEDNSIGLMEALSDVLNVAIGQTRGAQHIAGSGNKQATGILSSVTTANDVATSAAFTRQNIYDLMGLVDEAYHGVSSFLMNRKSLMAMLAFTGTPPLVQTLQDGITRILGAYPLIISGHMPNDAAGNKPVVFGALGYYYIRDVQGIVVTRDVSAAADDGAVRVRFRARGDGHYVNPGAGTNALAGIIRS